MLDAHEDRVSASTNSLPNAGGPHARMSNAYRHLDFSYQVRVYHICTQIPSHIFEFTQSTNNQIPVIDYKTHSNKW